MAEFKTKSHQV